MTTEIRPSLVRHFFRPSLRASALFLIAARGGAKGKIARNLLVSLHGCDVSAGAEFDGPPNLPHPVGIVVGKGSRIGRDVTLYQGVTIGGNGKGGYPTLERGAIIRPNSTIVGAVTIGEHAEIGAHSLVFKSVVPYGVLRGIATPGDGSEHRRSSTRPLEQD
jgi:serine O-acetyltransferase